MHSLQINVNRRFSDGFTANAALSFNSSRANRTVEEYDREPTLWWDDNNSRPFRVSGGAVYELPFGAGRRMLNDGGVWAALAGGWQTGRHLRVSAGLADRLQQQPVLLRQYRRHQEGQAGDRAEPERHDRCDEVLVQRRGLREGPDQDADQLPDAGLPVPDRRPAGPGPDLRQPELRAELRLGGRRTFQARIDIQNLLNYAAYNNPVTDPTNTNFGKVTTAVASAGAMRFFNFVVRFTF